MPTKEQLQQAIKDQYQRELPLLDVERMKLSFLAWLAELKLPASTEVATWDDCIKTFPSSDQDKQQDSGHRLGLALRLHTKENQYLIAVTESLNPTDRGVYSLSLHVNWKDQERFQQKILEETYRGAFDDALRARHTLWAQTVRWGDVSDALNACAVKILGNELVAASPQTIKTEKLDRVGPVIANFPHPHND
jgi:hypothetical protein